MIEKKDLLEEMLNEEFARLAKEEENAVQKEDIGMLEEVEGDIYTGIQEKIQMPHQMKGSHIAVLGNIKHLLHHAFPHIARVGVIDG